MTTAEAYVVARTIRDASTYEVILPDPAFMRLSAETQTWMGRMGSNWTQRLTLHECDELLSLLIAKALT